MFDFKGFDNKLLEIKNFFQSDLKSIQTGRATPAVLDNIYVEAYGSNMQIAHLASVTLEDAKTIRVFPYDKSVLSNIEKAINDANIGLSVVSDSEGLRVIFPALTTERRMQYVKLAKEKLEEARIKIKTSREEIKKKIEEGAKNGEYGKDEEKRFLDEMQKRVDNINSELEMIFENKEKEIMGN